MAKSLTPNMIQVPLDYKGEKSFSKAEYGAIIRIMKADKVDFDTAQKVYFSPAVP